LSFQLGQYYLAFIAVILLARGLGPLFYVPLLMDFAFEICLDTGLMSGWDIRLLIIAYEFGIFIWVMALAGNLRKSTFVVMLVVDLAVVINGMLPNIQASGTGQNFWNSTSTAILDVWQTSVIVVVGSMVIRSTVIAKLHGQYVDILTNPKKRFVLPIGAWALIQESLEYLKPIIPLWLYNHRFVIAANVLVWGWIALELPLYLMYRRLKKQYS
jgi:hypothetical protein